MTPSGGVKSIATRRSPTTTKDTKDTKEDHLFFLPFVSFVSFVVIVSRYTPVESSLVAEVQPHADHRPPWIDECRELTDRSSS
jgi:hypothetical protein